MKHADEVVYVVGLVAARIQRLGQREERLRVVGEVVDVENGFWVRDVVLLQVGIKTCSWSSEDGEVQTFFLHVHFGNLSASAHKRAANNKCLSQELFSGINSSFDTLNQGNQSQPVAGQFL